MNGSAGVNSSRATAGLDLSPVRSLVASIARRAAGQDWRPALLLALAAAAVQAAFLIETAHVPAFRYPLIDAATYHNQAQALLAGKGVPGAFWQAPGYPYLLALLERLCGPSPAATRSFQALLLAPLLSVLAWRVGRRVLPPAWAFAAGLAVSLIGPLLFYASQLLPAAPAAVAITAAFLLTLRAVERPSGWRWLIAGAATGFATVIVATSAALLPVWAWAAWRTPAACRVRVRHLAALAIGAALLVLPVSLHNYAHTGRMVWMSNNDGINLYIGNSRDWRVLLTRLPGLDWDNLVSMPFRQGGARDSVEASRWFRRQALLEMRQDPAGAVRRLALKAAAFWHGREIPRNIDLYGWRGGSVLLRTTVWHRLIYFPSGLLIPLAVAGVLALRLRREGVFLVAAVVSFGLLVALFFPCSRYRVPVLPLLAVLATAGLHALVSAARLRQWGLALGLAAAAAVVGVCANGPLDWPTDALRYDVRLLKSVGTSADVYGGDLPAAKKFYLEALRLDPDFSDAHFALGTVYDRLGDALRAEACYQAALVPRPDHDKAHINLALDLFRRGRLDEAVEHLAAAEKVNPLNANAWYNHAAVLLQAGRRREALEPLRRASELDPQYGAPYRLLVGEIQK